VNSDFAHLQVRLSALERTIRLYRYGMVVMVAALVAAAALGRVEAQDSSRLRVRD
jgi:hypothetical protein